MVRKRARLLVLDGYPEEHRDPLAENGGTLAGELYAAMLKSYLPDAEIDILFPADAGCRLPTGSGLRDYHGITWTGSSLTIHNDKDDRVVRQIDFAKAAYEANVPMFGSCWAAQMAVTAAGGKCAKNPKGREFGLARKITLTPEGRNHPMFAGKKSVFDAFTSHEDEVSELPAGATLLASNDFCNVQAVAVDHKGGSFWAVQYHPEYNFNEVASLCRWRRDALTAQGNFASIEDADQYIAKLQALHISPDASHLRWQLAVDNDILDNCIKQQEVRNWIEAKVTPRLSD
ncbi:type 1 glutamine amidotransferase [Sneathiella sp.]|uniref:type 1 glutamine amidotransferase n=1 Tax=Sneathiella sp. TaxID=1964365 RepID=UPI0035660D49